jgi:hypothetical protein
VTPTKVRDLLAIAILAGGIGYLLTWAFYLNLPPVPIAAPISFAVLAGLEAFLAWTTRARLQGKPGTRPILPLAVARIVVLAKASAVLGALGLGAYAGFFSYLAGELAKRAPSNDLPTAIFGMAASLALVIAALALEHVCKTDNPPPGPDAPDDDSWSERDR